MSTEIRNAPTMLASKEAERKTKKKQEQNSINRYDTLDNSR